MYSQIPISPSLRSKYSSGNQGGQRKISNADEMNTPASPYSNDTVPRDSDGLGAFDSRSRDPEFSGFGDQRFGFPHGGPKPASSSTAVADAKGADFDGSGAPPVGRFPGNPGSLALGGAASQAQANSTAPMSTPLPAFPLPPVPTLSGPPAPGGAQHHSPSNARPVQPPSAMQSAHYLSTHFHKSSLNSNPLNISAPPCQKAPFPEGAGFDGASSLSRKMQDNKERLEQLNIPRAMLASRGGPPPSGDHLRSGSQPRSQEASKGQGSLPPGRSLASHVGIQESSSSKGASRSNPRLPPKAPGIGSDNAFKLNISRPAHNAQTGHDSPEMSVKGAETGSERSVAAGLLKETVRPPTAPTFLPSNKPGPDAGSCQADTSMARPPAQSNGAAPPMSLGFFRSLDHQGDSRTSQTPRQVPSGVPRPPTAPNSTSKSSLPKVDLLMNLMDRTVENKRREFEKLNKLKSALSELGDFNKKLLEENTRLKSGNNGSSGSQEGGSLLSRDVSSSSAELTRSYQAPMSDGVDLFVPDSQDPETQVSSLKTIINKKNQRISELERRLSSGGFRGEPPKQECGVLHSLLQRVRARDERLKASLEEMEGLHIGSVIDRTNVCIKVLAEKDYGRLKTMANDVLNQIEFNYKALSVTLDHLFEQQCSILERIKHEDGVESQLESSNPHSASNSKEFGLQEANPKASVHAVSNSPKKTLDAHHHCHLVQKDGQDVFGPRQAQDLKSHHHPRTGGEFPVAQQVLEQEMGRPLEESRDQELKHGYGQREERVGAFPHEDRSGQPGREGGGLSSVRDATAAETSQSEEAYAQDHRREFDFNPAGGIPGKEETRCHEYFQSQNPGITGTGEGRSSPVCRAERGGSSLVAPGAEQQRGHYDDGFYQHEGSDYAERVPPTVFAAYYEGGGSENSDLFSMSSPMVSPDGVYLDSHYQYQVPANYGNI